MLRPVVSFVIAALAVLSVHTAAAFVAPSPPGGGVGLAIRNDCPPGLAKKGTGCLPPGQAKKYAVGSPVPAGVPFRRAPSDVVLRYPPPPPGHYYAYVDDDLVLVAAASSIIVSVIDALRR